MPRVKSESSNLVVTANAGQRKNNGRVNVCSG